MADSFQGLAKKYNGFIVPIYKVDIDGTDLKENYFLDNLALELTAGYEAGCCSFTIKNAFTSSKDFTVKLDDKLEKLIKLGNIAKVSIGYSNSEKIEMFNGYIDNIYVEFADDKDAEIIVECLDAKGIMMNSMRSEVKKDIKKYSEAVKNTFNNYSKLITKQIIDATPEMKPVEQHNESDYSFVVRLAQKLNYSFYIINGEAIFQSNSKEKKIGLNVKKSDMIKSFSIHTALKEQVSEVIVRSNNEKSPNKPFEGKASSYKNVTDGSNVSAESRMVISNKVTKLLIDHAVASNDDAKLIAEAALTRASYFLLHGKMECVGLPELLPGKGIEIEGFGSLCDRKYYITKTTHVINDEGYITKCELKVNKI